MTFSTFFFFQAEDGIRDTSVTGVQTCALPICGHRGSESALPRPADPLRHQHASALRSCGGPPYLRGTGRDRRHRPRSEERRVGKECSSRWSPYSEKEKRKKDEQEMAR